MGVNLRQLPIQFSSSEIFKDLTNKSRISVNEELAFLIRLPCVTSYHRGKECVCFSKKSVLARCKDGSSDVEDNFVSSSECSIFGSLFFGVEELFSPCEFFFSVKQCFDS
eukprot:TRINITY_DN66888_c3_g1_i1.p2 TRINITY_DN66888_c3_g1~~TRINITY_DN66888_c3_g1_i1.p2  ORF type:complete len:110 (+),score=8.14 TRINITY_DN66888_c3_g1_i1:423-752(+)